MPTIVDGETGRELSYANALLVLQAVFKTLGVGELPDTNCFNWKLNESGEVVNKLAGRTVTHKWPKGYPATSIRWEVTWKVEDGLLRLSVNIRIIESVSDAEAANKENYRFEGVFSEKTDLQNEVIGLLMQALPPKDSALETAA